MADVIRKKISKLRPIGVACSLEEFIDSLASPDFELDVEDGQYCGNVIEDTIGVYSKTGAKLKLSDITIKVMPDKTELEDSFRNIY